MDSNKIAFFNNSSTLQRKRGSEIISILWENPWKSSFLWNKLFLHYSPRKKMKNGISAYLVVYHEEKVIERCLKSLVGVVNEIIVIHDGPCLDKTMEIAKKYTNHVFEKEHKGISELHRIDILQKCHFPWVIQMDADEFLSEELKEKLPTLIKGKEIDAYAFLWKVWNGKKYLTKNFPFKTILFRKEKMGYITFPGRDPFTYGKKKNESLILEHQPNYNNYTIDVFQKKWYPWIKFMLIFW